MPKFVWEPVAAAEYGGPIRLTIGAEESGSHQPAHLGERFVGLAFVMQAVEYGRSVGLRQLQLDLLDRY